MNLADERFHSVENVMSTLCYLLWLPTGIGYAAFYMYTHPAELKYVDEGDMQERLS